MASSSVSMHSRYGVSLVKTKEGRPLHASFARNLCQHINPYMPLNTCFLLLRLDHASCKAGLLVLPYAGMGSAMEPILAW